MFTGNCMDSFMQITGTDIIQWICLLLVLHRKVLVQGMSSPLNVGPTDVGISEWVYGPKLQFSLGQSVKSH